MNHTKESLLAKFNTHKYRDLFISLAVDAMGCASYIIPALGETSDVVIAPLSAAIIYMVHKTKVGSAVGLIEESLPFTDFIPTATLIWFKRYYWNKDSTLKEFLEDETKTNQIIESYVK
ncbi:MAG: hypothetical protein OHK0038_25100 [Flammeovirgaceae bacterium]